MVARGESRRNCYRPRSKIAVNAPDEFKLDESLIDRKVMDGRVAVFTERSVAAAMTSPLGTLLLAWVQATVTGWGKALMWLCLINLVELLIIGIGYRYRRARSRGEDALPWAQRMIFATFLVGLAWGSTVWIFWTEGQYLYYLLNLTVLIGVSGICVVVMSPFRMATVLFNGGLLLLPVLHLAFFPNDLRMEIAAGLTILFVLLLQYGRVAEQQLTSSLRHAERNKELLSDLSQRTAALEASQADLNRAQTIGNIGSWTCDPTNGTMRLSAETCRIFGLPQGTTGNHEGYLTRVHPEDRAAVHLAWQSALDNGDAFDNEHRIIVGEQIRWVRQKAEMSFDGGTRPKHCVGTTQDITERRTAVEALREQEEFFRLITENIGDFIAVLDLDGRRLYNSPSYHRFFGVERDLRGTDSFAEIHPDDQEHVRQVFRETIQSGVGHQIEYRFRTADGRFRLLESLGSVIRDSEGRVARVVVVSHDITERKQIEETLRLTRISVDAASDALFWITPDARFVDANVAACRSLGYTREELLDLKVSDVDPHYNLEQWTGHFTALKEQGSLTFESEHRAKNGRVFPVEIAANYVQLGSEDRNCAFVRDISERKRTEELMRESEQHFRTLANGGSTLIWTSGLDKLCNYFNEPWLRFTGRSLEKEVGDGWLQGVHPDDLDHCLQSYVEAFDRREAFSMEYRLRHVDGSYRWIRDDGNPRYDSQGAFLGYIGFCVDISLQKEAEEKIRNLAFYDPLTGLPNRRLLLDRLEKALATSTRHKREGALLFIDLDNFKTLNDTLGHDIGDLLLQQVAQRLTSCVRESDTVARLGGDEFVVMLEDLSEDKQDAASQVEAVGEKILATLNQPYQLAQYAYRNTPSIGVSLFANHGKTIDELLKQADLAMYQAKAAGRNAMRFFDPEMQAVVTSRAAMEAGLREAVQKNQFLLHYQAQVDGHGRVTGSEALLRWQHPLRGMVSPAEFIPLAEETRLILPLGQWVLQTACTQLARWATRPEMAHLTLAVNVSAHQFNQPDFVDGVLAALSDSGANPQRLKLELTESLLVQNVQEIIEKMFALKARGVGFSLDDFGTGYSSLSYLKRLPLDQLKIDQSFVRDVLVDSNDAAIARTVVALAQSLGLGVIAEGVETAPQRAFLANSGCNAYQGYFFSRPLPVAGFEEYAKQM
jgi:diguanylate cyclase (GGDEF)-like protein/PAS domain S-box-containing protein